MNNWIEIDAAALTANYKAIQHQIGVDTEVLAVIKANAYGHGAEYCAPILVRAGAQWLGVTCASEGQRVRSALNQAGLDANILIMCGLLPQDVPVILSDRLTPIVWTSEQISWLTGANINIHIEIDTGMGRQGIRPGPDFDHLLRLIKASTLKVEALFTHFSSSEVADSKITYAQQDLFFQAVRQAANLTPRYLHAGNTSTVDNPLHPNENNRDRWLLDLAASIGAQPMVRTGLALYGFCLPIAGPALSHLRPDLQPVLTWKANILSINHLAEGDTVGYNATFKAERPMRTALLPIGYADGLRRELSFPDGWVMIHGQKAPILGRISMNLTVADVTEIKEVAPGDQATILGTGITAEDHASLAGTIPYEILCGIHPCG